MKVITFGCRLNSYESALIQELGKDMEKAIVINTCTVTHEAERQCAQEIRKQRRQNPDALIIVTGCAAQLHPEKYLKMKEVDRVLGNYDKLREECLHSDDQKIVSDVQTQTLDLPLVSSFERKTRAFLQIQQGCSHACTFCVIPLVRGKNQSVEPSQLVKQAQIFVDKGYQEIVLTGVDILSYSFDFIDLLKRLLHEVKGLKRLRLGSLDPAVVTEELLDLFKTEEKMMPSLHLSVQSGDNLILKRMARRHTREKVISISKYISQNVPNISIGADIITGFPTEDEAAFQNTFDLVKEANLVHLHVFPYSIRPGTKAALMPQVEKKIAKERSERLRKEGEQNLKHFLETFIGKEVTVLLEDNQRGFTENYLSAKVLTPHLEGDLVTGKVKGIENNVLVL